MSTSRRGKPCERKPETNSATSPEALQQPEPVLVVPGLERLGEQERERLQLSAVRARLEQRLGAREHREQVHDVVLGVILDRQVLLLERGAERLAKEFADIGNRQQLGIAGRHCLPPRQQCQLRPVRAENLLSASQLVVAVGDAEC